MRPLPKLMTSNPRKISEFSRLGIQAEIGSACADLREPKAHPFFVCAHKAFSCGNGSLCEDTRLDVDGADIGILAKFSLSELAALSGRRARFACCLSLAELDSCSVWEGRVDGRIGSPQGSPAFGFDCYFYPDGAKGLSLAELEALGRKDEFSARARACSAYASLPPVAKLPFADLAAFEGPWQEG